MDFIYNNPELLDQWVNYRKNQDQEYYKEHSATLVLQFEKELRDKGFIFEISEQVLSFMPKNKEIILPIAIKYYQEAKRLRRRNEQEYFMQFFYYKGIEEVVPILLDDFKSLEIRDIDRWSIGDCLYQIQSKKYIDEYLEIISNAEYGQSRQMLILLVGHFKVDKAIPILINLLEDEDVRLHAIDALGCFKREEFRGYFEKYENSSHPGWRREARKALKKINK